MMREGRTRRGGAVGPGGACGDLPAEARTEGGVSSPGRLPSRRVFLRDPRPTHSSQVPAGQPPAPPREVPSPPGSKDSGTASLLAATAWTPSSASSGRPEPAPEHKAPLRTCCARPPLVYRAERSPPPPRSASPRASAPPPALGSGRTIGCRARVRDRRRALRRNGRSRGESGCVAWDAVTAVRAGEPMTVALWGT